MKIGLYNILVGFVYVYMLLSTTYLGVISFIKIIEKDFHLIMLILIALFIFGLFLWYYFFKKFQIIIITKTKVISVQPFLFKKSEILKNDIKSKKWSSWMTSRSDMFLTLGIKDSQNNKIFISDAQFGNFYSLVKEITDCEDKKPKQLFLFQAKENSISNKFLMACFFFMLLVTFNVLLNKGNPNGLLFKISFLLINLFLIYASINRYLQYKRVKNKA